MNTSETESATDFNVTAHGAVGDGRTLDTSAINDAIAAANAAGGGVVRFPAGHYLCYSIHLRSNVELHLGPGAVIVAAEPSEDGTQGYDLPEPNKWNFYQDFGHSHWHNSLIWGEELENIAITGPGKIFGRGLSRSTYHHDDQHTRRDQLPEERRAGIKLPVAVNAPKEGSITPGPFSFPSVWDTMAPGVATRSIALKNCRNVIFRDFTIFHGGHFAILATAVDNWVCDGLRIDTNRDAIDIDCCQNVRVSNCTVNSPYDDGICLKSSFGLGYARPCENITITNCQLSGFEEGTLLDGTRKRTVERPTGRIKFGTEANGGFRNITISNCVFDFCRGIALEEVDGGLMEDISITNITMRDICNAPIFIRLGARLRGPDPIAVGTARRIKIDTVVATDVARDHGIIIAGVAGHCVEDVSLSNILITYRGGGTAADAAREVPEDEKGYPEPSHLGTISSYGMFARHVRRLALDRVELRYAAEERRPAVRLEDVQDVDFDRVKLQLAASDAPRIVAKDVRDLTLRNCPGLRDGVHADATDLKF